MLSNEIKWRQLYQKLCLLTQGGRTLLVACFIDHARGLVLVPLAEARETDGETGFAPLTDAAELFYPAEEAATADITLLPAPVETALRGAYAARLTELQACYAADTAVEETRSIELLDPHRAPLAPDTITVYIGHADQETEPRAYPVRVEALQSPQLVGTLLCEAPEVGLAAGAQVAFVIVRQTEQGNRIICLSVVQ